MTSREKILAFGLTAALGYGGFKACSGEKNSIKTTKPPVTVERIEYLRQLKDHGVPVGADVKDRPYPASIYTEPILPPLPWLDETPKKPQEQQPPQN